jgi:hypothetical protein
MEQFNQQILLLCDLIILSIIQRVRHFHRLLNHLSQFQ